MDLADLIIYNAEYFTREQVEQVNYLVAIGADEEADKLVDQIVEQYDGCTLCGSIPMTTSCNNAGCDV